MTRRSAVALAGILLLLVALGQYEIRRPPDTSVSATPIAIPSIPTPRYASASLVPSPATKPVVRKPVVRKPVVRKPVVRKPVAKRPPVTKPWLFPALKQPVSRENQAVFEFKRGVSYSDRENWEVAIVYYTEAIRLNPRYAAAYHNRGVAYREKGDTAKVASDFAKAEEFKGLPAEHIVISPEKTFSTGSVPFQIICVLDEDSILVVSTHRVGIDAATGKKTPDATKRPSKPSRLEWSKWSLRTGRQLHKVTKPLPFPPRDVMASPDGSWIGIYRDSNNGEEETTGTGMVTIWNTDSGREIATWKTQRLSEFCHITVSPSGKRIALVAMGPPSGEGAIPEFALEEDLTSSIQVWHVQEQRLEETLLAKQGVLVSSLAFDHDGQHLSALIAEFDERNDKAGYTAVVWRTHDWKQAAKIEFAKRFTWFPTIHHFGPEVVVLDEGFIFRAGRLVLTDTRSEKTTRTLASNEAPRLPAGFSPDGRRFAFRNIRSTTPGSGSLIGLFWGANPFGVKNVNEIAVLDIKSGAIVARLREPPFVPGTFAFTKDGRQIISGSSDGSIRIWKLPPPR